jgi:hypothetical protein
MDVALMLLTTIQPFAITRRSRSVPNGNIKDAANIADVHPEPTARDALRWGPNHGEAPTDLAVNRCDLVAGEDAERSTSAPGSQQPLIIELFLPSSGLIAKEATHTPRIPGVILYHLTIQSEQQNFYAMTESHKKTLCRNSLSDLVSFATRRRIGVSARVAKQGFGLVACGKTPEH